MRGGGVVEDVRSRDMDLFAIKFHRMRGFLQNNVSGMGFPSASIRAARSRSNGSHSLSQLSIEYTFHTR